MNRADGICRKVTGRRGVTDGNGDAGPAGIHCKDGEKSRVQEAYNHWDR